MSVQGKTADAVAFLQRWRPEGPWVITTVVPDSGGKISTRTFKVTQTKELAAFIDASQGKANIYFTVNRTLTEVSSKPSKRDMAQMDWLHVDVDPRVPPQEAKTQEDLDDHNMRERGRILAQLMKFEPPPTVIVDSGGGFQGFWRLDPPQQIGGSEATANQLEAYNRQLEHLLGGDHCFNIDRIMRLPGTLNVPDAKKRKKGRQVALAQVYQWEDVAYPLTTFTPAPSVQTLDDRRASLGGGATVKISSNLRRFTFEELPLLRDETKVLIAHGHDPDSPGKYPSRSEVLFKVCLDMVRANCDDDTIAGVITDPDYRISESVLEKPRPEQYAARQIARAREAAIDPWLVKLNEKHAVIEDIGGKCRIISEVFDAALKRPRISRQSFEDFRNRYLNQKVEIGKDKDGRPEYAPLGNWWLKHPMRRQYETITFAPEQNPENAYNLWRGFACEAIPGDCTLYLQHLKTYICRGNEEHYKYLLGWMARTVQQPACQGETAVVLKGTRGAGKGTVPKWFGRLFGRHYLQVSNSTHLVGNFNSHLQDCIVLFADEAFFAGDRRHESVLKTLVTEETIPIEGKGVDIVTSPNYTHIIMASNNEWVVPSGNRERRWFVLDVDDRMAQDTGYFKALNDQMENGGLEALLFFLMRYDISNFNVRDVPKTEALRDQQMFSLGYEEQWWFEKLSDGRLLEDHEEWVRDVQKTELQDDYYKFCNRVRHPRPASPTALGKFLKKICPPGTLGTEQRKARVTTYTSYGEPVTKEGRPYFYLMPELTEARAHFERTFGGGVQWNTKAETVQEQPRLETTTPTQQQDRPPF
jgi:hypothetical protein